MTNNSSEFDDKNDQIKENDEFTKQWHRSELSDMDWDTTSRNTEKYSDCKQYSYR